jgi:hypothetical protein
MVLRLELEHKNGVEVFDPNQQIARILENPEAVGQWQPVPGARSVISGKPAVLYRTGDLEVPLTVDEYVALVGRELEPEEFFKLLEHYGMEFDWHEDFYATDTGDAMQPKDLRGRMTTQSAPKS